MENTKLRYNRDKSPLENIEVFFNAISFNRFVWMERETEGKITGYLDSPWKNEIGLGSLTLDFQQMFAEHLVETSMDESQVISHGHALKECRVLLQSLNHIYKPSFTSILITTRSAVPE